MFFDVKVEAFVAEPGEKERKPPVTPQYRGDINTQEESSQTCQQGKAGSVNLMVNDYMVA